MIAKRRKYRKKLLKAEKMRNMSLETFKQSQERSQLRWPAKTKKTEKSKWSRHHDIPERES